MSRPESKAELRLVKPGSISFPGDELSPTWVFQLPLAPAIIRLISAPSCPVLGFVGLLVLLVLVYFFNHQ